VDAKLAKDFQAVLKEFQKAQRLAAERETVYAPLVHKPSLPSRLMLIDGLCLLLWFCVLISWLW